MTDLPKPFELSAIAEGFFLNLEQRGYARNTVRGYKSRIATFVSFLGSLEDNSAINTAQDYLELFGEFLAGLGLKTQSINSTCRTVVNLLSFAGVQVTWNSSQTVESTTSVLSSAQETLLLELLVDDRCPPRDAAILALALCCGLRTSEIQRLTKEDIVLAGADGSWVLLVRCGSAHEFRIFDIPMPAAAIAAIHRWLKASPDGLLFPGKFGTLISCSALDAAIRRTAHCAGLNVSIRTLRNTLISRLIRDRIPLSVIGSVTGSRTYDLARRFNSASARPVSQAQCTGMVCSSAGIRVDQNVQNSSG